MQNAQKEFFTQSYASRNAVPERDKKCRLNLASLDTPGRCPNDNLLNMKKQLSAKQRLRYLLIFDDVQRRIPVQRSVGR